MQKINVMQMVLDEMSVQRKTAADISRKLNMKYASIAGMLGRPTLQVQRLIELSEVFQYNFFRKIAAMLPYQNPKAEKANNSVEIELTSLEEIASLKEKLKYFEIENAILKDILKTLAGSR